MTVQSNFSEGGQLEIVQHPHPILATVATPVTDFSTIPALVLTMRQAMKEHRGVGIAANQIGDPRAVCIVKGTVMVNPTVVKTSGRALLALEGCLSVKASGEAYPRTAHDFITVAFQNSKGEKVVQTFSDWDARIVQHELRHLNGKTIADA